MPQLNQLNVFLFKLVSLYVSTINLVYFLELNLRLYSVARIIWPSLIQTSQIICTIIADTTHHHWQPMLNCPFNSNPDFTQSCLIQTFTQTTLHWHPMLNCPFNSNPNFAQSGIGIPLLLCSDNLHAPIIHTIFLHICVRIKWAPLYVCQVNWREFGVLLTI